MSYEICYVCETWGETDHDDGCEWDGARYYCARCVKAQIAAEDVTGDPYEELRIKEREYHDDRPDDKSEKGSWSNWRNVTDRRTDGK